MKSNWAYGFSLNHEGAGVGTIYYASTYFKKEGIVNPASAEAYTTEEIDAIVADAAEDSDKYIFDIPEDAVIGMNVLGTEKTFWYDEENSGKIVASAAPLMLDKDSGEMKDQTGNVVATAKV